MPSTIDNILTTLRGADILPDPQVNYGISDGLEPPYLSVLDYSHTYDYDTGGKAIRNASFKIVIVDKAQTHAETVAAQVDALINTTDAATPTTILCLQTSYAVGQLQTQPYYQFGVEMVYELKETV